MASKSKRVGIVLCLAAVAVAAGGLGLARFSGGTSTDNAYVRGDVTAISARVGGYVTAVEVGDNQAVHAGDVLFRIDDRDYRVRVAQAEANVAAAQAQFDSIMATSRNIDDAIGTAVTTMLDQGRAPGFPTASRVLSALSRAALRWTLRASMAAQRTHRRCMRRLKA